MKRTNYKLVNILLVLLIIYVLFLLRDLWGGLFFKVVAVLKPFVIAFAIAYALYPFLKWLQKKKVPKVLSVIIIVTLTVAFLAILIYSLIPIISEQIISLFSSTMTFLSDISNKFDIDHLL